MSGIFVDRNFYAESPATYNRL